MRIPKTIFDRELLETCRIERSMDGETATIEVNSVEIEIFEAERPDYIHPTGEAMSAPTHIGHILDPLNNIQKEDIVVRTEKNDADKYPNLIIINLFTESGVQILELEQFLI